MKQAKNTVTAGGQMAGGDIHNNSHTHVVYEAQQRTSVILDHIERLQSEIDGAVVTTEILEDLHYYTRPRPTQQSLEEKLDAANRSDELPTAIELKEVFAKHVTKYQLHNSAQHLFALCLGFAHAFFQSEIEPQIAAGATRAQIDRLITREVVLPVADRMEGWLSPQAIRGAVYTLAANCHIAWHTR